MSFIHSGSETRINRVSSDKMDRGQLAISQHSSLIKNIVTSFDNDAENVLQVTGKNLLSPLLCKSDNLILKLH